MWRTRDLDGLSFFFFFPLGASIIIFVYNIHQPLYIKYIKDELCAPDSATIYNIESRANVHNSQQAGVPI